MTISKNDKFESIFTLLDKFSKSLYAFCDVFFKVISWTFALSLLLGIAKMPHNLFSKVVFFFLPTVGVCLLCTFLFVQVIRLFRFPIRRLQAKTGWFGLILFIVFIMSPLYISMFTIFYFVPTIIKDLMIYQHPVNLSHK